VLELPSSRAILTTAIGPLVIKCRQIISGSTVLIFTIFAPNDTYFCLNMTDLGLFFDSSRDVAMATVFMAKFGYMRSFGRAAFDNGLQYPHSDSKIFNGNIINIDIMAKLPTRPTLITLAFRHGMGYHYLNVCINSANDASISCKNFVNFSPLR